jgi:hypothetical protein
MSEPRFDPVTDGQRSPADWTPQEMRDFYADGGELQYATSDCSSQEEKDFAKARECFAIDVKRDSYPGELDPPYYERSFTRTETELVHGPIEDPFPDRIDTTKLRQDLSPQVLATSSDVASCTGKYIFKSLLDSGGSDSLINRRYLPKNAVLKPVKNGRYITTAGIFESSAEVTIKGLCLPEFSFTRRFGKLNFNVFNSPECRHNIILGHNVLSLAKMTLDFNKLTTTWCEDEVAFHPQNYFLDNKKIRDLLDPRQQ